MPLEVLVPTRLREVIAAARPGAVIVGRNACLAEGRIDRHLGAPSLLQGDPRSIQPHSTVACKHRHRTPTRRREPTASGTRAILLCSPPGLPGQPLQDRLVLREDLLKTRLELFVGAALLDVGVDRVADSLRDALLISTREHLEDGGPLVVEAQGHGLAHDVPLWGWGYRRRPVTAAAAG